MLLVKILRRRSDELKKVQGNSDKQCWGKVNLILKVMHYNIDPVLKN